MFGYSSSALAVWSLYSCALFVGKVEELIQVPGNDMQVGSSIDGMKHPADQNIPPPPPPLRLMESIPNEDD